MSSHTPGPWYWRGERIESGSGSCGDDFIAKINDVSLQRQENARLITAAPDMLAALRLANEVLAAAGLKETQAVIADAITLATSGRKHG